MKIALLFPGYGSQYVGMGKDLYDEYRIVQEYFEEASNCLNSNCVKLCFASSDAELSKLVNAYTALFLMGSATYAVLKENDIKPDVIIGYNNGEYAALFAGGCFSFPDGLYLLNKFCAFYQEFIDGTDIGLMRIQGAETKRIEAACAQVSYQESRAFVAIYNSLTDHIVGGNPDQLAQISTLLDKNGNVEYIPVEGGLHSDLMNHIAEQLKLYLEKVDFNDLHTPLLNNIDGEKIIRGIDIKEYLIRQIISPLMFNIVIRKLADYDCIIVANPGELLAAMLKQQHPEKFVISITKKEDIELVKKMIKEEHK